MNPNDQPETIRAVFLSNSGEFTEKTFARYLSNGEPVTALDNRTSGRLNSLITQRYYDNVIKIVRDLPSLVRDAVVDSAKRIERSYSGRDFSDLSSKPEVDRLSPENRKAFDSALQSIEGMTNNNAAVLLDHFVDKRAKRNEPVYSVNGVPTPQSLVENVIVVSFVMGANIMAVKRVIDSLKDSEPLVAARAIAREFDLALPIANRHASSPLAAQVRARVKPAMTCDS